MSVTRMYKRGEITSGRQQAVNRFLVPIKWTGKGETEAPSGVRITVELKVGQGGEVFRGKETLLAEELD